MNTFETPEDAALKLAEAAKAGDLISFGFTDQKLGRTFSYVTHELTQALKSWPKFNTAHEGFAILMEEVDELWSHVKTNQKKRDLKAMRKEAIQVAAMALRFAHEVCDEENGRK